MTVVVEITNQRYIHIHAQQMFTNLRYGRCSFRRINRNADKFGTGTGELGHLNRRLQHVGRVGVGHGLNHDWCTAPHSHLTDGDATCLFTLQDHRICLDAVN